MRQSVSYPDTVYNELPVFSAKTEWHGKARNAYYCAWNGQTKRMAFGLKRRHRQRVRTVLEYIDRHLDGCLQLERLAGIACYSPFHFHRLFSAMVGEPVATYVRRRRLERSAIEIVRTTRPFTGIALEAGFDNPTSFTRAFKRLFGISPAELRRSGELDSIVSSVQSHALYHSEVSMVPEIREFASLTVVAATGRGLIDHNFTRAATTAFRIIGDYITEHHLFGSVGRCLGIMPDDPSLVEPSECRYLAAFELTGETELPRHDAIEILDIPAGRVAVFLHKGPYDTLWKTWNTAYRDWLPEAGMELRDVPPFEIYLNDPQKISSEELLTEVCIPVQ